MQNIWLVIRHEIYITLRSTGYVIFAFILPVAAVLILMGVKLIQARSGDDSTASNPSSWHTMDVEGYVDQSGLIRLIPDNITTDHLISFEAEEQAQEALEAGEISAYYLIPADIIQSGEIYYVYPDTRSYLDDGQSWVMEWTLIFNLLEEDKELADRVWNPIWDVTATNIAPQAPSGTPSGEDCSHPGSACQSNDLVSYIPSIMVGLFFISFMTSSSRLFNSISVEKENRVIEVLMLSISPRQLLAGKTFGLACAGILQMIFWLGAIYFAFNLAGSTLKLPENFEFPLGLLAWSLVFFLGGYGVYAGLMAGAGALVPKMKEAGVANYIAMFPLFLGYAFGMMAPLVKASDRAFIVFLSFFPLTSPVVMTMRLTNNTVPLWQLVLSALLLLVSAYYILHLVAAMFHAQNLLSGQSFSLRRYFKVMVGRG
jgi:ABC-2 type transport system permease protein